MDACPATWHDITDVKLDHAGKWARMVVVTTAAGDPIRLPEIPPGDLEHVREIWVAAGSLEAEGP